MRLIKSLVQQECRLVLRNLNELLNPLIFYFMIVCLFPLSSPHEKALLTQFAPCFIWVASLLASILALSHTFYYDAEVDALSTLLLCPQPLSMLMLVRLLTRWCLIHAPLFITTPLLGLMLKLPWPLMKILLLTLLLGSPSIYLIGAIAAALTVQLRQQGILLALLITPLIIPILIFGANSVFLAKQHVSLFTPLGLLGAILLLSLTLAPLAVSGALQIGSLND